jgi:type IV pilus assembly protein PilA
MCYRHETHAVLTDCVPAIFGEGAFTRMKLSEPMLCPKCGNAVPEGEQFCRICGQRITAAPTDAVAGEFQGIAQTSGTAIASLGFGLFLFFLPFSIVAIVLGQISLSQIRKSAGRIKGEGMAIAGLVLGYLGIAALPVILIIAAIAIPNLLRARMAANEASAVATVRMVNLAERAFASAHADTGYTCMLSDLSDARLIAIPLVNDRRNGYRFALQACTSAHDNGPNLRYRIVAYPLVHNQTGIRAFCSDESGAIKVEDSGSAQACVANGSRLGQ